MKPQKYWQDRCMAAEKYLKIAFREDVVQDVKDMYFRKWQAAVLSSQDQSLTAYEKSKEEQQSEKVPIHKCKYCEAMTEQDDSQCWNNPAKQSTQEPESKEGKTIKEIIYETFDSEGLHVKIMEIVEPKTEQCMERWASQQVTKATKDLTDEVERLKARIPISQMPPDGCAVIGYDSDDEPYIVHYDSDEGHWINNATGQFITRFLINWQPLPSKPINPTDTKEI